MHLVFHQVNQFQHIFVADSHFFFKRFAGAAVVKRNTAVIIRQVFGGVFGARFTRKSFIVQNFLFRFADFFHHFGFARAVKHRGSGVVMQVVRRPTEHGFQQLAHVHTGRNTQRRKHNIQRGAVRQERHIFFRQNTRNHPFVPVAAGHFVPNVQFAFGSNKHFDGFVDRHAQLIPLFSEFRFAGEVFVRFFLHQFIQRVQAGFFFLIFRIFQRFFGVGQSAFALFFQKFQRGIFFVHQRFQAGFFFGFRQLFFAYKYAGADYFAAGAGRNAQGGIHHVIGFFTEDYF